MTKTLPNPSAPRRDSETAIDVDFAPVPTRARHDGWTPDRQTDFIEALAQTGCVDHAARAVKMNPASAYRLRARHDAQSFRAAWDHALEYAVSRLSDAVLSRAIHGVARPVFFQGEQIGERRYFDERLAMFILRMRDPMRYGAWIDRADSASRHPEAPPLGLARAVNRLTDDGWADAQGEPRSLDPIDFPCIRMNRHGSEQEGDEDAATLQAEVSRLRHAMLTAEIRAINAEAALAGARGTDGAGEKGGGA